MISLFRKHSLNHGLTLVELTVAMAVALIIAGAVIWSFKPVERRMLQNASVQLQADIRYAQRMAIIEGRRWGVAFDGEANLYHIGTFRHLAGFGYVIDRIEKTIPLENGVFIFHLSHDNMVYLPRGTAASGFSVMLAKGPYRQRLTATVSGGRVHVYSITGG